MPSALTTSLALKEWDVVVAALEQGHQAILIRKGGLDDPGGRLALPDRPFWLYPTLFHERGVFLKPEHHSLLVPGMHRTPREVGRTVPRPAGHERPVTPGHVALRAVAEVAGVVTAPSLEALQAVTERTVFTDRYARLRYRWRPDDRPLVVVLTVSTLPRPHEIEERFEYGGCRSWVELRDPPDPAGAEPVWSDARVRAELDAVRALLGTEGAA